VAGTDTARAVIANGFVHLGGGSLTATRLTVAATGHIFGKGTVMGSVFNKGVLCANGGLLDVTGAVTGSGRLTIVSGATLELGGATAQQVNYAPGTSTLQLDAPASYTGRIARLALGDAIKFSSETVSSAVISGSTLTVTGSAGVTTYQVAGALAGNHFAVQSDGHTIVLTAGGVLSPMAANFVAPAEAPLATTAIATPPTTPTVGEVTGLAALLDNTMNAGAMGEVSDPTAHLAALGWVDPIQHIGATIWHQSH
jgi:hypothetical protein